MAIRKLHTTPSATHSGNSAPHGYLSPVFKYSSTPTNPPMPSLTYPARQSLDGDACPGVSHRKNLSLNLTDTSECMDPSANRYSAVRQSYTPSILPLTTSPPSPIPIQNTIPGMITSSYPTVTVNDVHSYPNA